MNEYIVKKICSSFIKNDIISESQKEYFEYGLFLIVSSFNIFISIMIISIFINRVLMSLIFSICFYTVRSLCGGYHCRNSKACYFTSISIYLLFALSSYISIDILTTLNTVLSVIGMSLIVILAPVENINNKVSLERKKKSKVVILALCILHIILVITLKTESMIFHLYPLSFSLIVTGVMLLIGNNNVFNLLKIKNKNLGGASYEKSINEEGSKSS